jgi:rod shape determining protein RodA
MVDYAGTRAMARQRRRRVAADALPLVRRLDWILLGAVAGAVAYGLWVISGVTHDDVPGDPSHFVIRQAIFAAVGVVGFVAVLLIDPSVYQRYQRVLYGGTLGVMLLVFLGGAAARGSRRWIDVSFFRFQPSEFGKLLLVLFLAGFLADRGRRVSDLRTILTAIGLALAPIALVFAQPDLGTALVYTAALAAVLFVAGTRWRHVAVLGTVAVVVVLAVLWLLPSGGVHVLSDYQYQRITSFLHPDRSPQGSTYNIHQSITAVGAGGPHGRGIKGATQTNLHYLPEHATDFVFASLSEERGFLGASALLLLYLLIVWRGLKAVTLARDAFSAIAAGGIVFAFLFQVFVNAGMTIGIAPITGIPLPFVSVGGSAMVSNLLAMGVLQAIYARGRRR